MTAGERHPERGKVHPNLTEGNDLKPKPATVWLPPAPASQTQDAGSISHLKRPAVLGGIDPVLAGVNGQAPLSIGGFAPTLLCPWTVPQVCHASPDSCCSSKASAQTVTSPARAGCSGTSWIYSCTHQCPLVAAASSEMFAWAPLPFTLLQNIPGMLTALGWGGKQHWRNTEQPAWSTDYSLPAWRFQPLGFSERKGVPVAP